MFVTVVEASVDEPVTVRFVKFATAEVITFVKIALIDANNALTPEDDDVPVSVDDAPENVPPANVFAVTVLPATVWPVMFVTVVEARVDEALTLRKFVYVVVAYVVEANRVVKLPAPVPGAIHARLPLPSVESTVPAAPSAPGKTQVVVAVMLSGARKPTYCVPFASSSRNLRKPVSPGFVPTGKIVAAEGKQFASVGPHGSIE